MPIHTIGKLIGTTEELKAVSAHARRLRDLEAAYFRAAPDRLAAASRIKDFRAGVLVIAADHAPVATKLRQMAPRLLSTIRKVEPRVTGLKIEVQVSVDSHHTPEPASKNTLPVDAVQKFDALAQTLPPGQLKSAVGKLVRHHDPGVQKAQTAKTRRSMR